MQDKALYFFDKHTLFYSDLTFDVLEILKVMGVAAILWQLFLIINPYVTPTQDYLLE